MSSPTPIRSRLPDRGRRALPALTTTLLALGITVVARAAPQVPRTAFVYHVYVDPNFGADSEAYDLNPGGSATTVPPLGSHPYIDPLTQSRQIHGALQHAPYPFRTLSGSQGALAYIDAVMPILPWSLEQDRTVTHVVIHCLPGMYGPTTAAGVAVPLDLRNGLPFNGETFPILLDRDRICLQGTSALDTIFDARGAAVPILEIGSPNGQVSFAETFIDALTLRGARDSENLRGSGAGIWVRGPNSVKATVSNCFIYDNAVGLALDAAHDENAPATTFHRMYIVNNTFAWNGIGIWADATVPRSTPPQHASLIINNIFDSAARPGTYTGNAGVGSCFEGVLETNLRVIQRGSTLSSVPLLDFNAWHPGRANLGTVSLPGWPIAARPSGWGSLQPRVDMTAYGTWPRTFFVGDALTISTAQLDSKHDLRLCPYVRPDGSAPGTDPAALTPNPCIDAGIDSGQGRTLEIGTQSLNAIAALPGWGPGLQSYGLVSTQQPNPNVEEAPVSGWDLDTEGFGNPRIVPDLPEPTEEHYGYIDIGADECDSLIAAGYVDGTRMFTAPPVAGATALTVDHRRVFFFGRPGVTRPRPSANSVLGKLFAWYAHVQAPIDANAGNYTTVPYWLPTPPTQLEPLRWVQITTPSGFQAMPRPPIPRHLECDISPHLAADFHPLWGTPLMSMVATTPPNALWADAYATNPWFDSLRLPWPADHEEDRVVDNQCLFHNRHGIGHTTYLSQAGLLPTETYVASAHLNPPGSFIQSTPGETRLLQTWGTATFGPFGACSGTTLLHGSWCYNDQPGGCPDLLPEFPGEAGKGRRFNLETAPDAQGGVLRSNLQTFLFVFPGELLPAAPGAPMSELPAREMDSRLREQEVNR
jgi:hypothetical protein